MDTFWKSVKLSCFPKGNVTPDEYNRTTTTMTTPMTRRMTRNCTTLEEKTGSEGDTGCSVHSVHHRCTVHTGCSCKCAPSCIAGSSRANFLPLEPFFPDFARNLFLRCALIRHLFMLGLLGCMGSRGNFARGGRVGDGEGEKGGGGDGGGG